MQRLSFRLAVPAAFALIAAVAAPAPATAGGEGWVEIGVRVNHGHVHGRHVHAYHVESARPRLRSNRPPVGFYPIHDGPSLYYGYHYYHVPSYPVPIYPTDRAVVVAQPVVVQQRVVAYGATSAHVAWCQARYRSYRVGDNSFQPYHGPRRVCVSPY